MTPAFAVVTWKWKPLPGYRSEFTAETVNVLRRMVARHYPDPHRFICVTDDPVGIDPDIEVLPLWNDHASVPSPFGDKNPSCYRRLRAFAPDIAESFGPRFVSMDLDCVITGDLRPLWNRTEDFVIWGDTNPRTAYNGSMFLLSAGARRKVWDDFDPKDSPKRAKAAGCFGSDQGWISFCLGPSEQRWTKADGVYSFRNDVRPSNASHLPQGARVVMFHGRYDPWSPLVQQIAPWVKQHWC